MTIITTSHAQKNRLFFLWFISFFCFSFYFFIHFKPIKSKIIVKPGEVATIEYIVENPGNMATTGIATFSYYPRKFGSYISKLNCFCYDAQTLEPKQKEKYTVVLLIDPEVTKDSKTKNVKEVTIQFTFFDYKEYKKNKS